MEAIWKCFLLGFAFLLDVVCTYLYIRRVRLIYPKLDYKYFEFNPIVRWSWQEFGFELGTLLTPIIVSPFWFVGIFATLLIPNFHMVFIGVYAVVFSMHLTVLEEIYSKEPTQMKKLYDKAYGGKT